MTPSRETLESPPPPPASALDAPSSLARRLGLFDATMIVMGGIIGSGIFLNPSEVAREVNTAPVILGAWAAGGVIALLGAFVYAELAARRPLVGGQYAYIREAYHPAVAFVYGWALLLVIQSGGMAAVAITFAKYFKELSGITAREWIVAVAALAVLTAINCMGVRAGSSLQSALMVLKIVAIVGLVVCGLFVSGQAAGSEQIAQASSEQPTGDPALLAAFGAAMVPVLFAYGGWQTASFIAGEVREPRKNLPRGLLLGVMGVTALYLAVNFVCVRALGPAGLAATDTPATEVMRQAFGDTGARLIGVGIVVSTLGFLSQSILTSPRVYFAMAEDRLFFKSVSWLSPRTRVPVVAIALQGLLAMVIAYWGKYSQILSYVVSIDFIFFGLTATCIFILRRRDAKQLNQAQYKMPGHPVTTALFIAACWLVVANTVYKNPGNTWIGLAILAAGVPAYFFWRWWRRTS
ncbi:MAG TPA: amino acid permease [Blastocatellia bacterium]|nr:amino acid permease [Blastocatellia bacterium]